MSLRTFTVYLADGGIFDVEAPSLRKALAQGEKQAQGKEIIAAIDAECLPTPPRTVPFLAVFLRNPAALPLQSAE